MLLGDTSFKGEPHMDDRGENFKRSGNTGNLELVEGDLTKFTNVRTITFLKNNLDVSTWGREYKPKISRDIN